MEPHSRPTDDPAQWDIDRVVEELCTAEGQCRLYEPGRLPADFEERLRYNQIDGNQLIHEIKNARRQELFFQAMGIDKFAQKTFLINCIETLQVKSWKFESITGEKISTASKRKGDKAEELSITSPTHAPDMKRRRLWPQLMMTRREPSQQQVSGYFRDSGLANYNILHYDELTPTADHEVQAFNFLDRNIRICVGHQLQVNRLLKRAWLASFITVPNVRCQRKQPVDAIRPLNDPLYDEVLPVYGESDHEYDTETWEEVQKEEGERGPQLPPHEHLTSQEIDAILKDVVSRYESEWWREKMPSLRYKALPTWQELHKGSTTATRKLLQDVGKIDKRIMAIWHGIGMAGPWNTERDLTRAAANLQPSIRDRLKMKWLLNLANQKHKPPKAALASWGPSNKTKSISMEEGNDTDVAEDLSSDSDDMLPAPRQASLSKASELGDLISKRRKAPAFIVIRDDEPNEANIPLPASKIKAQPKLRNAPDPTRTVDIIDLTDEPDELPAAQAFDSLVNLDEKSEKEIWEFACAFSGHDPTKTDSTNPEHCHNFQGLDIALKPHQLWAVTRMLFTYRFEKTFGVLLADGMGVGKTLESSCGIILTPYIRLAGQDVIHDRKHGQGRHLLASTPSRQQASDAECPSGTYARGFACPCIERLPTARLLASRCLPRGPAVVLVPPGLREQWYQQLCRYISPESVLGDTRKTEIWSIHTDAERVTSAMRQKYPRIKFVAASELQDDEITDDKWNWERAPNHPQQAFLQLNAKRNRDTSHIIMIMPASSALAGIQKESALLVKSDEGEVLEPFFVKPSWVVMDESHNQIAENTIVWKFIGEKLINRSASPTYLVSISGTPIRRSPLALKPFFNIVTSSVVQHWKEPPMYNPQHDFDQWAKGSDWLVTHRDDSESVDKVKCVAYEQRFDECKELGKKVLGPYMIQRQSHYEFFGFPIVPLPTMNVEVVPFSNFPAAYFEDIREFINMSKEQLDERLEKKLASWQASNPGTRGYRPTMENVISEMDKGFGSQGRFYELGLCATFPALAPLLLRGQPSRFRSQDIEGNLNAMSDADLRGHALWPYLDTLRNSSQKMDFIIQKVQEMLEDDERHKDVADTRRVLRKKMVIFALIPSTAFLIAFILRKELPNIRQTLVLAKDAPSKRGVLYASFCRMTDEEVPEDRDPNDPLILITTARISGEGFNMTRANYAIMVEPAFAKQVENQAFYRVHRHGQQATTHLFTLYSSWNPAEIIIRSRQDARSKLLLDESIWKLPGTNL